MATPAWSLVFIGARQFVEAVDGGGWESDTAAGDDTFFNSGAVAAARRRHGLFFSFSFQLGRGAYVEDSTPPASLARRSWSFRGRNRRSWSRSAL